MPPDTIWSDFLNKSDVKLNARGLEWKNLMSECLMATQIKRNESVSDKHLNPDVVMNIRHAMAKECLKIPPTPRCLIQSEALKLIREDNNRKLQKIKEENMINKEIGKLKQILEFNGMLTKKYLEADEKQKLEQPLPKITSKVKLWVIKANRQYRMEKNKKEKISEKAVHKTEKLETTPARKGCLTNEKGKVHSRTNDESRDEMCIKIFTSPETEEREITKVEVKPLPPLIDMMNQKRVKRAWQTWRIYVQRQKRRERDKKIYADKIEAFLEKLQRPERETKTKLRITTCKQEPKMFKLPERAKTALNDKETLKKLEKLMVEVKTSQTEVFQRLQSRNERMMKTFRQNPKFLFRMEERREERLRRRREIQERKQKLKEEKENLEKEKAEEEKRLKEEEKQKRLKELKEKRRLEKYKKEEERKKREKEKRDEVLANSHYQKYLLRSYGLRPWVQLMALADAQYKHAVEFHGRRLLLSFVKWRATVREQVEQKSRRAEDLYNRHLLERCWGSWTQLRGERISKKQVAEDWYDFKITEKMLKKWMWFTEMEQLEYLKKKEMADHHYKKKLKMKYLRTLRNYPECKRKEREIEIRKSKWRQKVKEILPDYQPVEIGEDQ